MLCRHAAITPISVNSSPVVVESGRQAGIAGAGVELAAHGNRWRRRHVDLQRLRGLPAGPQHQASTGLITGTPTAPGTTSGARHGQRRHAVDASATFKWTVTGNAPLVVDAAAASAAASSSAAPVTYTATRDAAASTCATNGISATARPRRRYSTSPTVTHTFTAPGIYFVTLTVDRRRRRPDRSQTFVQTIQLPLTANAPRSSSAISRTKRARRQRARLGREPGQRLGQRLRRRRPNAKLAEIAVGTAPRSVAIAPDGRIWVMNNECRRPSASSSPTTPRRRADDHAAARLAAVRSRVLAGRRIARSSCSKARRAAQARRLERRAARQRRRRPESAPRLDRRRRRARLRLALHHAAAAG